MSGWDACTQEPSPALRWLECHPSFVMAVQAAVTAAAIAVAIAIPLYLEWRSRKREVNANRRLALAFIDGLRGPLLHIALEVTRAQMHFSKLEAASPDWPGIPDALRALKINLPPQLSVLQAEAHKFDQVILSPFTYLIAMITNFNSYVDQLVGIANESLKSIASERDTIFRSLSESLETIRTKTGDTQAVLKSL